LRLDQGPAWLTGRLWACDEVNGVDEQEQKQDLGPRADQKSVPGARRHRFAAGAGRSPAVANT